jgi:ubiquinone biosynthesis protein UbiJ
MFEPLALPVLNRLLRANTWALERLRVHAGKTALLECPPLALRLTVLDDGQVAPAAAASTADVTVRATPPLLLRLAARDETAWSDAEVSGDVELAAAIDYVRRNLEWDFEEDLSRVVGDVAAHRMANAARQLERWGREAALSLGRAVAEYSTYESPLVAAAPSVDEFIRGVDEVRDQVERLEKRLELLKSALGRGHAPA